MKGTHETISHVAKDVGIVGLFSVIVKTTDFKVVLCVVIECYLFVVIFVE